MTRSLLVALLVGLPAAAPAQDRAADEAKIRAQLSGWEAAWNRGDAAAIAAFYDVDADRTFAHGITIRSRESILGMYRDAFAQELPDGVERTLRVHDVAIRFITDDVAVVDYGFIATGIPILPRARVDNQATVVMVMRNGVWLRAAQRNWVPFEPTAECVQQCRFSGRGVRQGAP